MRPNKVAIFSKIEVIPVSRKIFVGAISKQKKTPKAVQPEASGVQKKIKDPSGGPRIIW